MSIPARPRYQAQNPAISHYSLGWLSCTAYAMAMAIDKATLGKQHPSGADVRKLTGDTVGGLTLPQVARVAVNEYDTPCEVHVGSSAATPPYLLAQLRAGRGVVVQGNTSALLNTPYRSTGGPVNHAVYANEVRATTAGVQVLVYDPAADGRWSYVDQGPTWWPWTRLLAFAAALRPWGDSDPRTLGSGRIYSGFMHDTEPHVHLRYGGVRTAKFPDRTRANCAAGRVVNVRATPSLTSAIVDHLRDGELFTAYQHVGTRFGNHDGNRWVSTSDLIHEGGAT